MSRGQKEEHNAVGLDSAVFQQPGPFLARFVWSMILGAPVGLGPGRAHRFAPVSMKRRMVHRPGPVLGMVRRRPAGEPVSPTREGDE